MIGRRRNDMLILVLEDEEDTSRTVWNLFHSGMSSIERIQAPDLSDVRRPIVSHIMLRQSKLLY